MSPAMAPAAVGSILTTMEQLDALPHLAVVIGDPECKNARESDRAIAIQKREDGTSTSAWWYPAWDTDIWNALATTEIVHRFGLGPFLVAWLPSPTPADEQAAA